MEFPRWTRQWCVKNNASFHPRLSATCVPVAMERQHRLPRKIIVGRTCGSRRRRFLAFMFLASVLLSLATAVATQDIVNRTTDTNTNNSGRKRSLVINSDKLEDDVIIATNLDEEEVPVRHRQQKFSTGCNSCKMRAEMRSLSLAHIKEHVLSKLGFKEAPNVTGRLLPKLPPGFLDSYKLGVTSSGGISDEDDQYGMQNDQPSSYEGFQPGPKVVQEPDNYHARTDRVIAFAQPR